MSFAVVMALSLSPMGATDKPHIATCGVGTAVCLPLLLFFWWLANRAPLQMIKRVLCFRVTFESIQGYKALLPGAVGG